MALSEHGREYVSMPLHFTVNYLLRTYTRDYSNMFRPFIVAIFTEH
jgi:hypothetical protein